MEIFVTLLALAFLQVWGAKNPLHKDAWFYSWLSRVEKLHIRNQELASFFALAVPLVLLALLTWFLSGQSSWLMLPVAIFVLLYSFGRGEFFEIVREYTQACYVEDWDSAVTRAQRFYVHLDEVDQDDWSALHKQVFYQAGYRGFERMFAVLFWFFILGPIGALMYRLVFLFAQKGDSLSNRWLWIIEWPAVRVLGFSFALTGNFSGCIAHGKELFLCVKRPTIAVLSPMILGALAVNDELEPDCEITRKELTLMGKLFQRTLWFWLGLISLIIIFT